MRLFSGKGKGDVEEVEMNEFHEKYKSLLGVVPFTSTIEIIDNLSVVKGKGVKQMI